MRYLVSIVVIAGFLAACAAPEPKPEEKPAPTVEPKPSETKPEAPAAKPAVAPKVKADPFTDPASPLSKFSIHYDFDKSDVKDEFKPIVQAHAQYLAKNRGARIRIEGNCDERGSREYNLALGQRRADGVRAMMKLLGAADNQVETVSFGEEKPRCTEQHESCWSQNRRSDIVYLKKE